MPPAAPSAPLPYRERNRRRDNRPTMLMISSPAAMYDRSSQEACHPGRRWKAEPWHTFCAADSLSEQPAKDQRMTEGHCRASRRRCSRWRLSRWKPATDCDNNDSNNWLISIAPSGCGTGPRPLDRGDLMTGGVYTKDQRGVCVGGRSKKGRIGQIRRRATATSRPSPAGNWRRAGARGTGQRCPKLPHSSSPLFP